MKFKAIFLFFPMVFLVVIAAFSQTDEEEAIKQAIKNETLSYFNCDFDTWDSAVLNADYFSFSVTNVMDPGSLAYTKGKEFYDSNKARLQSPNCKSFDLKMDFSDWNIQIRGEVAWASYKETMTMPNNTVLEARTLKVLEKLDNNWKIVAISGVFDFNNASKPWNPKGK